MYLRRLCTVLTWYAPRHVCARAQVILLREGTDTSQGTAQLVSNINACVAVADTIRSTLGPRGMDKMVIDAQGNTTVSNDGATIMRLLEIVHPAAQTLVDVARAQDSEVRHHKTVDGACDEEIKERRLSLQQIHLRFVSEFMCVASSIAAVVIDVHS